MSTDFYTWVLHTTVKMDRFFRPMWKHCDNDQYRNAKMLCAALAGGYITNCLIKKIIVTKTKYDTKKKMKEKQEECRLAKQKLEEVLKEKEVQKSMPYDLNTNLKKDDRKEKKEREKKIEDYIPVEVQEKIVNLSFNDLMKELQSGKLTAVDVLHAYQIKALEVDKRTNCITEVVWEAEEMALDRDLNITQKKGPLYGIPISVKETYRMPGYPCTGGMAFYLDDPVTEENILLQVLKKQGAVIFARTNVPQTLMTFECSNSIYGITSNPHDPSRMPGGSSGGEAALIGGGGSILGMGGDIGGSIRIPAHMCGCCGIKPTGGRLSRGGQNKFNRGQKLVQTQTGPMAAEVDALVTCMRSLLVPEMFKLDPTIPPIPFREEIYGDKRRLTIGFYVDDGNLKSAPACQRAVLEVKAILEAQGHTVVPFKPVDIFRMVALFLKSVFADGGQSYVDVLETDIIHYTALLPIIGFRLPFWLRKFLSYVAKLITKDQFTSILLKEGCGVKSIAEYWSLAVNIEKYRSDFLTKWRDNKLDAVICPGFAYPAVPTGKVVTVTGGVTYTNLYNLLDYPAGTLKVTNVTQQDVDDFKNYPSNTRMEKFIRQYSKGSVGLPVGVQFASLPFQEELILRLMKDVESSLR